MFGGFCPFPMRLTQDANTGVSAAQWQRLTADLVGVSFVRPLAVLDVNVAGSPTLYYYSGVNGKGSAHAPSMAWINPGILDLTWDDAYEDEFGVSREFTVLFGLVAGHSPISRMGSVTCSGRAYARVVTDNVSTPNGRVSVLVFGTFGPARGIHEYGGHPSKTETTVEKTPFAYTSYLEYREAEGSWLNKEATGYLHSLNLSLARLSAAERRCGERLTCNSFPGTATDSLDEWCQSLGVPTSGLDDWQKRDACVARLAAARGPSDFAIDEAVSDLLGDMLQGITRYYGATPSDEPDGTYWSGGTLGPSSMSLGGGAWLSPRSHVFINVFKAPGMSDVEFDYRVNVQLYRLLDSILPAHATFDWGTNQDYGFILDESLIGFDAL